MQLPGALQSALKIATNFERAYFVFYENDSSDDTLEILHRFRDSHKTVDVISESNVPGVREERLARGRTTILLRAQEILRNDAADDSQKLVCMMDLDDVNHSILNFEHALKLVMSSPNLTNPLQSRPIRDFIITTCGPCVPVWSQPSAYTFRDVELGLIMGCP